MSTTAEGIETNEEFEWLRAQGCDQAQGFLFSRPLPANAYRDLLAARETRGPWLHQHDGIPFARVVNG